MKCIIHNDKDAVGQCNTCWWWLCKDCIHNFTTPICPQCNLKWWEQKLKDINSLKYLLPLYWFWVAIVLFLLTGKAITDSLKFYPALNNSVIIAIFILGLYWLFWIFTYLGWVWIWSRNQDTNTITITTNNSIVAMVLRKAFKLWFAIIIWFFVWPYKLYHLKKEYKECIRMIGGI